VVSDEVGTSRLLKGLGIDPNLVERVAFDHSVGSRPTITVWFVPNREQMERLASDFVEVYELAVRGE